MANPSHKLVYPFSHRNYTYLPKLTSFAVIFADTLAYDSFELSIYRSGAASHLNFLITVAVSGDSTAWTVIRNSTDFNKSAAIDL